MIDTPYEFVLSDGETYQFSPITLRDWSAFSRWSNARRGQSADAAMSFDDLMSEAQTLDGMIWLCHRSVSKHHKVGRDALMDLIGSLERLSQIVLPIMSPGGEEQQAGNPPAGDEPAT